MSNGLLLTSIEFAAEKHRNHHESHDELTGENCFYRVVAKAVSTLVGALLKPFPRQIYLIDDFGYVRGIAHNAQSPTSRVNIRQYFQTCLQHVDISELYRPLGNWCRRCVDRFSNQPHGDDAEVIDIFLSYVSVTDSWSEVDLSFCASLMNASHISVKGNVIRPKNHTLCPSWRLITDDKLDRIKLSSRFDHAWRSSLIDTRLH